MGLCGSCINCIPLEHVSNTGVTRPFPCMVKGQQRGLSVTLKGISQRDQTTILDIGQWRASEAQEVEQSDCEKEK